MKAVKRWRYYCDFCKKVTGRKSVMENHERGCTNNPDRICGLCELTGDDQVLMSDLKNLIDTLGSDGEEYGGFKSWEELTDESFKAICEASNNCPVCILAVMRQTGTRYTKFDFKKELASFWADYNDEHFDHGY
jgi:hypothetical protein